MDTGRGFFANSMNVFKHRGVFLVDHLGQIAAIIEQEVCIPWLAVNENGLFQTPIVLIFRFTFPRVHWHAVPSHGCGRMVLRGKDVARRPADFRPELAECTNQHGGLDGHMNTPNDLGAIQRLLGCVFALKRHQRWHFILC